MTRHWVLSLFAAVLLVQAGCQSDITVLNVVPRVASIGPVVKQSATRVEITFALQDYEENSVDVTIVMVDESGKETALTPGPGGHGNNGLSSSKSSDGKSHLFVWDTTGLTISGKIKLRLTPRDREFEGTAATTSEFTLDAGLAKEIFPIAPIE